MENEKYNSQNEKIKLLHREKISKNNLSDIFQTHYDDLLSKILKISQEKFLSYLTQQATFNLQIINNDVDDDLLLSVKEVFRQKYLKDFQIINKNFNLLKKQSLSDTNAKFNFLSIKNCYIHCSKCSEVKHKCGNELIYHTDNFIYCLKCNQVYNKNQLRLFCKGCNKKYYTTLRNFTSKKYQYFYVVKYKKYHCPKNEEISIQCLRCSSDLFFNIKGKNNIYNDTKEIKTILCPKCKLKFNLENICFKCKDCGENFKCQAKLKRNFSHNKKEILFLVHALRKNKNALPDISKYDKNCLCDISNANTFYHIDKGVLIEAKKNKQLKVICNKCFNIFDYNSINWICPFCNKNFIYITDSNKINKIKLRNENIDNTDENISLIYKNKEDKNFKYTIKLKNLANSSNIIDDKNQNQSEREKLKKIIDNIFEIYDNNNEADRQNGHKSKLNSEIVKKNVAFKSSKITNKSNILSLKDNDSINNIDNDFSYHDSEKYDNYPEVITIEDDDRNGNYVSISAVRKNQASKILKNNQNNNISKKIQSSKIPFPKKLLKRSKNKSTCILPIEKKNEIQNNQNISTPNNNLKKKYRNKKKTNYLFKLPNNLMKNRSLYKNIFYQNGYNYSRQKKNDYCFYNYYNYKSNYRNSNLYYQNNLTEYNSTYIFKGNIDSNYYKVIKILGKGTHGCTYLIVDPNTNELFALKKIFIIDQYDLKKNEDEISLIVKFLYKYPNINIVNVYGKEIKKIDQYNVILNVLMEAASYDWETELINRSKTKIYYTESELIAIFSSLVKTLAILQKNGIYHRDIKPKNILCFRNNLYKLSDFGEAVYNDAKFAETNNQTIRGTELYMSPLLFNAVKLFPNSLIKYNAGKSDVFSLGLCFLYASSLEYDCLYRVREIGDMISMNEMVYSYLGRLYSQEYINLIVKMLQLEEKLRPDFIELNTLLINS